MNMTSSSTSKFSPILDSLLSSEEVDEVSESESEDCPAEELEDIDEYESESELLESAAAPINCKCRFS
jgi:hypothetical protein